MYRKLQVVEKGDDFQKATAVTTAAIPSTVGPHEVLVRVLYSGVNATDINAIQNRYGGTLEVPYDLGLESMGEVVLVGAAVTTHAVGDWVVVYSRGGYTEYHVAPAACCLPIPSPDPSYLAITVSGLTAAVSLGEYGRPQKGEVALVTAAGGGTGSIAVQLLKQKYQCRVVGTCSSAEKEEYLRSIGCDDCVRYTVSDEELEERLTTVAPHGFDIVYESVGGKLRDAALRHLTVHGRMLLIGGISGYRTGEAWQLQGSDPFSNTAAMQLLKRSASLSGFMLPHHWSVIPSYFEDLKKRYADGELKARRDPHSFEGLENAHEAVAYLHSGKSCGKILLKVAADDDKKEK